MSAPLALARSLCHASAQVTPHSTRPLSISMCGIIGYVGKSEAVPILLDGLRRLEYRGYDSAGIATISDNAIQIRKRVGRINDLAGLIKEDPPHGSIGISHTRWATHG